VRSARFPRTLVALGLLGGALAAVPATAADPATPPDRPEQLRCGSLDFQVPRAEQYRHELPGGVVVYVVPDHSLPLVNIVLDFRTGAFREPADDPGLADLTATLMRVGGTTSRTPEQFDEQADFLAASIGSGAGETSAQASLNVLTKSLDDGLDLLFDMVRNPRFDEGRLAVEKGKILEAMKQRNDDAGDIAAREWDWLMYGHDHFSVRRTTAAELAAMDRQALVDFHRRTYGPQGLVVAVSGDVEPDDILARLGSHLAGWTDAEPAPWPPRGPDFTPEPGLYYVEKDIPQGKVEIGERSLKVDDWSNPELPALMVMNDILGGGGFTARLMKRVRSDEGLAYGAYSHFGLGAYWPTTFDVGYASKNRTVALAAKIVLEEIDRIRTEPVSDEELRVSKSSFVDTFPRAFESAAKIAGTFAQDEIQGRPHSYWYDYRQRIEAVTADQVLEVAKKYLHPKDLVMLVVGKWEEIAPGDPDGRAKMSDLFGGRATQLPLRDPLTLEPVAGP
jgi:zinc protease